MKLRVDPSDLLREYEAKYLGDKNGCNQGNYEDVTFSMLNEHAQRAVIIVGRAEFYAWDGFRHNTVLPSMTAFTIQIKGAVLYGC